MTLPKTVFRPGFAITRASHVVFEVSDLARSRAFYVDTLGFVVSDEDSNTLYLRGPEEGCHHSLVLKSATRPPANASAWIGGALTSPVQGECPARPL